MDAQNSPSNIDLQISQISNPIRMSSLRSINEFVNKEEENKVSINVERINLANNDKLRELEICYFLKYIISGNIYTLAT